MIYKGVIKKINSFFIQLQIVIIFLLLLVSNIAAQENPPRLKFEVINSDQGLPVGSMTGMLKDSKGFVWFISSNGITRYDGYEFKVFRSDPEDHNTISRGKVMNCAEDKNGNIWISCDILWGLNSYDPGTGKFTRYSENPFYKNNFPSGRVWRILFDKKNVMWMCVEGQGVYSWDQKSNKVVHYVHDPKDPSSLANNNTWDAAFDTSGNIYFCTPDNIDLLNVNTGKFSHFPLQLKMKSFNSHNTWDLGIYPDSKNNLWITTPEGLKSLNPLTRQLTEYKHDDNANSISGNRISMVRETPDGRIWIMSNTGLNIYDPVTKKFSFYQHDSRDPYSISSFQFGLLLDNSGVMWIQGQNLVNKLSLTPQKFHTSSSWPSCFFQDYQNKILFGHYYQGVSIFDPVSGTLTPFLPDNTAKKLLAGRTLQTIFQDNDSVYWFGVDFNQLITYDTKNRNWKIFHYKKDHPDSLGINEILAPVYQDKKSKIWFGGNYGISRYDPSTKKFRNYLINYERGMDPINSVSTVFDPGDGKIWFGSEGLSYYDLYKDSIVHVLFNQNDAAKILSQSRITCAFNAENLCMWIGTMGNGLFILDFKTGQCKRISTKDGLSDDEVFGIMKDRHGNLWLTTGNGLSKYIPPKNVFDEKDKGSIRIYSKSDGLPAKSCTIAHPLTSKDGTMYFVTQGGTEGLVYFNPDSLIDNPFHPPVVITDFKLFNKSIFSSNSNSILSTTIETTKEIRLTYKQNVFSFTFAALSFIHPESNRFAYKLDGFDKEWVYTDASKRFASYTNLNPGDYTFQVKASNNDGVWNETPTTIHLIITPPFWKTWWFRTLLIIAVVALAYGIYRYRLSQIIRLQNIRNKISNDLHDDIGSTLNSISVYSEVAKQDPSKHLPALEMIGESSRRIIDAMSDIVWTINPENDSFENIILRMRSLAFNLLRARNIEFTFRAEESLNNLKLSMENRRNFFLIFKESMNNLVKYAEATHVSIQLSYDDSLIRLMIQDNGKGFDASQNSNGNGLNSIKRRAKEMNAQVKIESTIGNGTSIELIMKA